MDTIRRNTRNGSHRAAQNVLVIGGDRFGLAVAEYLTEDAQSVTFVSETKLVDITDSVKSLHRTLSGANDVQALASENADTDLVVVIGSDSQALLVGYLIRRELDSCDVVAGISNPANASAFGGTGVEYIDIPQILAERICDRYE
jgi:Trk K+ transport system NAD-binding subunit